MDYVALLRFRDSISAADRDAALMRRAAWQYPSGLRLIAEYWAASGQVNVVSIFAADDYAPVMELQLEWGDVFEIDVSPAIAAAQGLEIGQSVAARVTRWQQPQS